MISKFLSTAIFAIIAVAGNPVFADTPSRILVQSTTSTENSGFYSYILPIFQNDTGLRVDVVSVGTGQAIKNARNGDADVLLVHAKTAEDAFVAEGFGRERFDLMYNDFVLVGPASDPAEVKSAKNLTQMLDRLAKSTTRFISRGDDSGTHKKERQLWANENLSAFATPSIQYLESGSGMGATLRMAMEQQAYTLTDRATWISFSDKKTHKILFEGAAELFNQYGIIAINPAKHAHVNALGAQVFVHWMLSDRGQNLIGQYKVAGQQLFFPNAKQ